MRKPILLMFLLFASMLSLAQDYVNVSFTSNTTDGLYCPFTTVNATNVTRGWTETLSYPDTVLVLANTVGLSEHKDKAFHLGDAFPNPFNGETYAFLELPEDSDVLLQLIRVDGVVVASRKLHLAFGTSRITVRMSAAHLAFLSATTSYGRQVVKLINMGRGTTDALDVDFVSTTTKSLDDAAPIRLNVTGEFEPGDLMRYEAQLLDGGATLYSTAVTHALYGDETVTLLFDLAQPVVTTNSVTEITQTSATCGGNVTDAGGLMVMARGVCWGTQHNPTVSGSHTSDGMGVGGFTSHMAGLTAGTTYHVRAYAVNRLGTSYGNEVSFTTEQTPNYTISVSANPSNGGTVTGGGSYQQGQSCTVHAVANTGYTFVKWTENGNQVSANANYTFTVAGNRTLVAHFTASSYVVSASPNPDGGGVITGAGGYEYGQSCTLSAVANTGFTFLKWTENGTQVSTNPTYTFTVTGNRNLVAQFQVHSHTITATANPANGGSVTGGGTYDYGQTCTVTASPGTGYNFVNWTENGAQVSSSNSYSFTVTNNRTLVANFAVQVTYPIVTTNQVTNITQTTATAGGNVTNAGGGTVTARGVCWSTSHNPTVSNSHTTDGTGTGSFTSSITNLTANTTYYVRAYATNSAGTAYGSEVSFTTLQNVTLPTVTTSQMTNITQTTATGGGNVTSDGGGSVTARGVCWSTSHNPTVSNNHTTNGTGTGSFTSSITNLTSNTTYYVRAYATNSAGTAYGNEVYFETEAIQNWPNGILPGSFSVSETQQVQFSQGNLQYQASTNTWRFALNQWDYVGSQNPYVGDPGGTVNGSDNHSISITYSGWIDLFGWGTSGWDNGNLCFHPCSIVSILPGYENIGFGYGPTDGTNYTYDLTGTYAFSDWGVYNQIVNGGNQAGLWRTLTNEEWSYLFVTRTTPSGVRYAKAQVNDVNGVILLPDNWNTSVYSLNNSNTSDALYSSNVITNSQWSILENAGAVFFPASGYRNGIGVGIDGRGCYWSVSASWSEAAGVLCFFEDHFDIPSADLRCIGNSVRLVRNSVNLPAVTTFTVSNVTQTTATGGGNVTSDGGSTVTARGVCWSTSHNPTISNSHTTNGTGTGSFTSSITNLTANTTYYVRAYATNSAGTAYGSEVSFNTLQNVTLPTVTTGQVTNITQTTALGGGNVTNAGDGTVTARGVCWSTSHNPTVSNSHTTNGTGTGSFTSSITNLTANTTYYVRAYATNSAGTAYGNEVSFTTLQNVTLPTVTTSQVTNIAQTTATGGGNVTNTGGGTVTARGVCWSTSVNPTVSNSHTTNGTGTGDFTSSITNLIASTTYYVRAYATNSAGTAYGNMVSFTTLNNGGNNYEFVDLGLPSGLLWATCNVGADSPEGYGYYFAWGETQPKDIYDWSTYQYCMGNDHTLTKYCSNANYGYNDFTDNLTTLLPEDDAVIANWAGNWRMPTQAEWQELLDNTTSIWIAQNGINGRLFTASNGSTLFLPAAGDNWNGYSGGGSHGTYWSSSLNTDIPNCGRCLGFNSDIGGMSNTSRNIGKTVRAVQSGPDVYHVTVLPSSVSGGTVTGGGTYQQGQSCTISATANSGYSFTNWTENGNVVSTNASYTFTVTGDRTLVAKFTLDQPPTGAINGLFTINANGDQVFFSQGNLQYRASTGTWRFAPNQYDCIGNANSNISQTNTGWIDLFGWGTSGWPTGANRYYQPWEWNGSASLFGPPGVNDLTDPYANSDWGVYNAISNGGNTTNTWRTLTGGSNGEWMYVFETRNTASGIRYAKAQVNGVSGVILLPDDWSTSFYPLYDTNNSEAWFSSNVISISQWTVLEQYGAVFLPASGWRNGGTTIYDVGSKGRYWSASVYNTSKAVSIFFSSSSVSSANYSRSYGLSVRLVHDY